MINDLEETIKQLLIVKGKLNRGEIDIRFEAPDREWVGKLSKPTIDFFLYDLHENIEFRQHDWIVSRRGDGTAFKQKPPLWVDLSYLATVWANAIEDEHRLLWHMLVVLTRFPILPKEVMQGALAKTDHKIQTKTAQTDGAYRSLAELWGSLETQLKPSINYVVTLPLDREVELKAPVVVSKRLKVGQLSEPKLRDELSRVGGRVYRRGEPEKGLGGVQVMVKEYGLVVTADELGYFKLPAIPPGDITLSVAGKDGKEVTKKAHLPEEKIEIPI